MAKHDRGDPVHRYAMLREADHLWALGNAERTLACLRSRELPDPTENLRCWRQWLGRFRDRFDDDNPHILDLRGSIASWTCRSGNTQEALRSCAELLPEQESALGRDHRITLATRGSFAYITGEMGEPREALRLFAELLPDAERVLGRAHADTLRIRDSIAYWTGKVGDASEADKERALGANHRDVLGTRANLAEWTGRVGNGWEALRLFTELVQDQERVLGRDHPDTLRTRANLADRTDELGDSDEALRLFVELLPDEERALGRDHPTTLVRLMTMAKFAIGNRDRALARRWLQDGLECALARFGPGHPMTKGFRKMIESCGCDGSGPTDTPSDWR
jgi:tetratricopeptide (TPR) repeat protein